MRDQGRSPDRAKMLERWPELAGPLRESFDAQDALRHRTAAFREPAAPDHETVPPREASASWCWREGWPGRMRSSASAEA